ncbi:MAG: hypothetical protein SRB1_01341 [Desulfobacteraceae bacterium Eth-SRB1]|nr:MAG: hypothetical protein SRB1_01341 [Desulfobacteraceae bacterium Eth-SRB1]
MKITESAIEKFAIELLEKQGYQYIYAPSIAQDLSACNAQAGSNTPAVFGNYVDIYDILQAVDDGATVRIFYESRLAKINLSEEGKQLIKDFDELPLSQPLPEEEESLLPSPSGGRAGDGGFVSNKIKAKWTQLEALIGSEDRIKQVAQDIINHFEQRQEVFEGKAMIVAMSRRIAADLYKGIINFQLSIIFRG